MTSTTTSGWDALEKKLNEAQDEKPVRTLKLCKDVDVRERFLTAQATFEKIDDYRKQVTAPPKDQAQAYDAEALALVETEHKAAKAELAAAQKAYDAITVVLRFTALERKALEALQGQHPATEEDEERGDSQAMETYAPALISAASLDGMPVDYARKALDTWAPSDAADLWRAAWSIQHQKRTDLGKG